MRNDTSTAPSPARARFISTRHAPTGKEIDYWCDHLYGKTRSAKFKVIGQANFHGEAAITAVGGLRLLDSHVGPQMIERSAAAIRAEGGASSGLYLVMSGSAEITMGSQRVQLRPGAGAIFNTDRTSTFVNRENVHLLYLQIPHAMITGGTATLERVGGRDLARSSTLFSLVSGYAAQLAQHGAGLDAALASRVGGNLTDLVNVMLAEVAQQAPPRPSESKTASLMRVRMFVEEHLAAPELTPLMVSQALHLSPRYINQLLETEGTSLGRLIWRLRLECVAGDLHDTTKAIYNIADLALARGFNHTTHFNKVFRQRYAMSPGEYRAHPQP